MMPEEKTCLQVAKQNGQNAIDLIVKMDLLDNNMQIQKTESSLCIPLLREPSDEAIVAIKKRFHEAKLTRAVFLEKQKPKETLLEELGRKLPPHLLASVPRALDVVGDIAIVEIPAELEPQKMVLGQAILKTHRNVRVVLAKAGKVSGIYRLRDLEFIAGKDRTNTIYREYGCTYYVDVAKAYFSPRLSHEHQRVALSANNGETIVDLFAGVGPFAIPIAKTQKDSKVYAIDINPEAIELLKKNTRLNRVENRVFPIVGDARQVVNEKLLGTADRVIMNLPETATEFVDVACKALKASGGIVHFYGFVRSPDTLENMKECFSESVEKAGRKVEEFLYAKAVRETAPFECQVVLDAKLL